MEENGIDLLRKVAFVAKLDKTEQDAFIERSMEDLRRRLQGWPQEPLSTNVSVGAFHELQVYYRVWKSSSIDIPVCIHLHVILLFHHG